MSDPELVVWADGSLHHPAGGISPELQTDARDPVISELTGDARLPQVTEDVFQRRQELAATTAAKMMRAAHQAQTALNRSHLFACDGADGKPVLPDPITFRDGVAIQILKRLAAQVRKLEDVPLGDDETELDREVKIAHILSQMTKQQAAMEQAVSKAVGCSTKAIQEAAKLQFAMKRHQDKMALAADRAMDAAEVEKIADA